MTSIAADGAYPEGLDLSPDGAELWVATRNDGDVSIIDVAAKTVSERLDLNFEDPNRLVFTPDGARVLVSDSATSVVVMDAASRTEIERFDLAPNALLVRPDGAVAYAALRGDDRVAVIDLETLEVVDEFATGAGSGPGCMFWLAGRAAEESSDAAGALADALTFHASFDNGLDADRAAADPLLYTAPSYDEQDQAEPGLGNPAVMLAEDAGRFGHALRFTARNQHAIFYRADGNIGYSPESWSGTVSFWLTPPPTSSRASAIRSRSPTPPTTTPPSGSTSRPRTRASSGWASSAIWRSGTRTDSGRTTIPPSPTGWPSSTNRRSPVTAGRTWPSRTRASAGRAAPPPCIWTASACRAGRTTSTSRSPGTSSAAPFASA